MIEAFKLLSLSGYARRHIHTEFDQELCKTLVIKYGLSCSDCNETLSVNKEVEVISPMVPAEKTERYYGERVTQTTLDKHTEEVKDDEGD